MKTTVRHPRSTAFLLAQVGAHAAANFAERLARLDLMPAHAGTLRVIHMNSGISQQALASMLRLPPSRLVVPPRRAGTAWPGRAARQPRGSPRLCATPDTERR